MTDRNRGSARTCRPWRCRSEEHTSELQSQSNLVCRLLLEKKKYSALRVTYVPTEVIVIITSEMSYIMNSNITTLVLRFRFDEIGVQIQSHALYTGHRSLAV